MSRSRYPKLRGKGKCRGCGSDVPKGRMTWCSSKCFEEHDPATARFRVYQRDKGVCCQCGFNAEKEKKRIHWMRHWGPVMPELHVWEKRFHRKTGFDRVRYARAVAVRIRHQKRWLQAAAMRVAKYVAMGFPTILQSMSWWHADHIVPHSEGGTHALENMRTLCILCHKARTKKWHKERKMAA